MLGSDKAINKTIIQSNMKIWKKSLDLSKMIIRAKCSKVQLTVSRVHMITYCKKEMS